MARFLHVADTKGQTKKYFLLVDVLLIILYDPSHGSEWLDVGSISSKLIQRIRDRINMYIRIFFDIEIND